MEMLGQQNRKRGRHCVQQPTYFKIIGTNFNYNLSTVLIGHVINNYYMILSFVRYWSKLSLVLGLYVV